MRDITDSFHEFVGHLQAATAMGLFMDEYVQIRKLVKKQEEKRQILEDTMNPLDFALIEVDLERKHRKQYDKLFREILEKRDTLASLELDMRQVLDQMKESRS